MRLASRFCNPILSNDPFCVSALSSLSISPPLRFLVFRSISILPRIPRLTPLPEKRRILKWFLHMVLANHMQEHREVNVGLHDLHPTCTIFFCWIVLEWIFQNDCAGFQIHTMPFETGHHGTDK